MRLEFLRYAENKILQHFVLVGLQPVVACEENLFRYLDVRDASVYSCLMGLEYIGLRAPLISDNLISSLAVTPRSQW